MASSSAAVAAGKMIRLRSFDGEEFEVNEDVAIQSQTIRHMIEYDHGDNVILLPNIKGNVLSKVLEYCTKYVESSADENLNSWDVEFVKVDLAVLYDLFLAANYLNIEELLKLTVHTWADMIKSKGVEEIQKTFNSVNDFTPEEEEKEIKKKNQWAFE